MTVRLLYVDRFTDRHGKERLYYRRPGGPRVSLPSADDPGFMQAYRDAADAYAMPDKDEPRGAPGTFDRLLFEYFRSPDFLRQQPSSKSTTRGILEAFAREYGTRRVATMPRKAVSTIIGKKVATPSAANNLLKKLRALMAFAIVNGWRSDDPTAKIPRFKEGEHHTWSDAEIGQFERRWPIGSRERTAFALALYTGQRRGDLVAMTRAAIDLPGGTIDVVQQKTGTRLSIPIHRDLRIALEAWPVEHVMVFAARGRPFSVAGFGNWFADAIDGAGLTKRCVLHGLRKAAARRLAEAGCSIHEIKSITGHKSLEEIERYTRAVEQRTLARAAVTRMEEHGGDRSIPTLVPKPEK